MNVCLRPLSIRGLACGLLAVGLFALPAPARATDREPAPARATDREPPPDYFLTCDPDSFAYIYDHWWDDHEIACELTIAGVTWPDCRVRIRGDSSRQYPKKSLKIKSDGADFPSGNDVLNLNADWLDRSYLRAVMASMLFERAGVPCFDASHARLHLNGTYFGLYIEVQNMDEAFLAANGLNPDGNLYKATHDGASLTIEEDLHALWEKKTNEDGDWSDLEQLVEDLAAVSDEDFTTWAAGALDLPEVVSLVACNALLSNGSTYYHNYYMYRDPDGPAGWQIFPWDVDKTFAYYGVAYNYDRTSSSVLRDNPLPEHVFASPAAFDLFHARVNELVASVFNLDFYDPVIDSLQTSIEASVAADETDDIVNLAVWNAVVTNERNTGITARAAYLQDQLDHAPPVFRLARLDEALQDTVVFTWRPSVDPDDDPVTYTLRYGPDVRMVDEATVTVPGLVDTFYTLVTDWPDSTYFWQVHALDADPEHTRQGTDSYSPFVIDRGSQLMPLVAADLTLDAASSPWFVGRDVEVLAGATLTLEAGVELRLAPGVSIMVRGALVAAGTAELPVRLRPAVDGTSWGALGFDQGNVASVLSHVVLERATQLALETPWVAAISARLTAVELEVVRFESCQRAVYAQSCDLVARGCEFPPNNAVEMLKVQSGTVVLDGCVFEVPPGDGDGVDIDAVASGEIRGCTFLDDRHGDDLIDIGTFSSGLLLIDNVLVGAHDKGVSVGEGSQVELVGNVILDCDVGVAVKDGSMAELERNTFFGNGTAVLVAEDAAGWGGGHVDLASCILAGSQLQALAVDEVSTADVSYSLADTELLAGVGNLQADPRLIDPTAGDVRLLPDSPCIDAGDPLAEPDPDGTRADMGARPFNQAVQALVINEINYNAAADFEPQDWVELYNPSAVDVDLGGLQFRDEGHAFIIPAGTVIAGDGYLVLAESLTDFQALFPGVEPVVGDLGFGFAGSGEVLQLAGADGEIYDEVPYDDAPPWPIEPDGGGPTLELRDPALDNALGESWAASYLHGTPGALNSVVVGVATEPPALTTGLEAVYPSPFNPRCTVVFALERAGLVTLAVHDLHGRRVAVLVDEVRPAGRHRIVWRGQDDQGRALASGTYLIRLQTAAGTETRKTMLLR